MARSAPSFVEPGPFAVSPLPPFAVPRELSEFTLRAAAGNIAAAAGAASADDVVDSSVELFLPGEKASPPSSSPLPRAPPPQPSTLCVILPGFLLSARRSYRTLAAHLASHGFAAALVDVDDPSASDQASARAAAAAAAACAARCVAAASAAGRAGAAPGSPPTPTPRVMLVGHSRGAKIAALAAGDWERFAPRGNGSVGPRGPPPLAGLVLLDPVDRATLGPPPGPSYPSALPSVRVLAARGLPILIVGAGDNADIVEPSAGWAAFSAAAAAGAAAAAAAAAASSTAPRVVELLLPRAKHLDFADTQSDALVGGLLNVMGNIFGGAGGVVGGGANADRPPGEALAVRRCADAAAAFWASVACGGGGGSSAFGASAVEAEVAALRRALVPDARARVIAAAGGKAAAAAAADKQQAAAAPAPAMTRETLLALRASQLQAILRERGTYYGDCFDKPALVERVLASSEGGGR